MHDCWRIGRVENDHRAHKRESKEEKKNSPAARTAIETLLREGEAATAARRGAATAARLLEGDGTLGAVERVVIIAESDIILGRECGRQKKEERDTCTHAHTEKGMRGIHAHIHASKLN